MRRFTAAAAGLGLAAGTLLVISPANAAGCPVDGTVPGTAANTYTVGTGGNDTTFYIDDRDFLDLDDNGTSGGVWIYQETNGVGHLQRGGDSYVESQLPGTVPRIEPIQVLPPDDSRPVFKSGTLLPNGFGGGSWSEELGGHDVCHDGGTPDRIIF